MTFNPAKPRVGTISTKSPRMSLRMINETTPVSTHWLLDLNFPLLEAQYHTEIPDLILSHLHKENIYLSLQNIVSELSLPNVPIEGCSSIL